MDFLVRFSQRMMDEVESPLSMTKAEAEAY